MRSFPIHVIVSALAVLYPNFKVYYTVDETDGDDSWSGFTGHVNKAMVAELLPPPSDDHSIYVCGPPGMVSYALANRFVFAFS